MMNEPTTTLTGQGRGQRRRAVATGATMAALVAALVGGSALLSTDPESGQHAEAALPAAGGSGTSAADLVSTVVAAPAAAPVTSVLDVAAAEDGVAPPWQDGQPPLPEGGLEPQNPSLPNAWEIPDARPTGVDHLDSFGAPRLGMNYPLMVPVSGVMVCNTGADDVEPLAGQDWMYYLGDGTGRDTGSVDIVVTGWEDSAAAFDALREDTMTFCIRDTATGWQPLEWAGHEGADDYLLFEAGSGTELDYGFAIVRQGDYLVGVTVTGADSAVITSAAGEIAAKTADNLQALDPVHGRD